MLARATRRANGKYTLGLLKMAQDAQRHHRITFTFVARPTADLRRALAVLGRLGLVAHVQVRPPRRPLPTEPRMITCALRYWEGQPLVGVVTTPRRPCSYHDLARREQLGGGGALLLWSQGRLRTARECVAARAGGLVVAVLTA